MTFDDIPDSAVWPNGMYQVRGEELKWAHANNGKLMARVQWKADQPEEWAGNMGFNNFVIGDDEDLEGARSNTWKKFGPRKFKEMLVAAQMQLGNLNPCNPNDREKIAGLFPGVVFLAQATVTKQQEGDYAGTDQNNWSFYKVGTRETKLGDKGGRPIPKTPPAAPPSAPPPPTAAPSPPSTPAPSNAPGMITCPGCKEQIAQADFAKHVNDCAKLT